MATRRLEKKNKELHERSEALQKALSHIQSGHTQDGLRVDFINNYIGSGVFTSQKFPKDAFLLEYRGELTSYKEGLRRERECDEDLGSFLYFFSDRNKKMCMDATLDPFDVNTGRMVNDSPVSSHACNCEMKIVTYSHEPHLCVFAVRDIAEGEELRYDYGACNLPWRVTGRHTEVVTSASGTSGTGTCKAKETAVHMTHNLAEEDSEVENSKDSVTSDISPYFGTSLGPVQRTICSSNISDSEDNEECDDDTDNYTPHESDESDSSSMDDDDIDDQGINDTGCMTTVTTPLATGMEDQPVKDICTSDQRDLTNDQGINDTGCMTTVTTPLATGMEDQPVKDICTSDQRDLMKKGAIHSQQSDIRMEDVRVMTSSNDKTQRVWDKKHCCVYCLKLYAKLARHLEQVHTDEIDVAKAISYSKNSTKIRLLLASLRNRGNFAPNTEVLKTSKGTLIPWRRPSVETDSSNYLPCEDCLAWFLKRDLWKQKQNCKQVQKQPMDNETGNARRGRHQASSAALLPVSTKATSQMRPLILDTMANDKIATVARTDDLIVLFGTKLFSKNGHEKHQHQYIKQKMREIARFLICMRQKNNQVKTFTDCINPTLFQNAIESVKDMCGYNAEKGTYTVPSLALKLGHSLSKCAKFLRSSAIQVQDHSLKLRAEEYNELVQTEWNTEVSGQALATLHNSTFNKTPRLPLARDLRELYLYLSRKANSLLPSLKESPSNELWRKLAEVTLAQVVLFNRRRGGETERMMVKQYTDGINQGAGNMQEEVAAALSRFERLLAKQFARVEIRGKRGRKVPILLTEAHKSQIEILNKQRNSCGIVPTNDYLFARIGESKTPIRTSDVLHKFTTNCPGVKKPEWITSTSLRKHVATVIKVLNLKDNEMDILAGFMGHDIRIHRNYYRLPENTLQLAKVSKILLHLESGDIHKYKGLSLDEIEMDENDVVQEDELDISESEDGDDKDEDVVQQSGKGESSSNSNLSKKRIKQGKRKDLTTKKATVRHIWTAEEKDALKRRFKQQINLQKTPGKLECVTAMQNEPSLASLPWAMIKFAVKNLISKRRKAYKM